jgi:hypothetical protein
MLVILNYTCIVSILLLLPSWLALLSAIHYWTIEKLKTYSFIVNFCLMYQDAARY